MNMKRLVPLFLAVVIFGSAEKSVAQQARFLGFDGGQKGIGLLLGKPTGGRYVHWLSWKRALFGDLVYDFDGVLYAYGSYAFYFYDAKDQWRKTKGFNSFLFYGAPGVVTGVRVKGSDTASSVVLGVRAAGGLEYIFGRGKWAMRAELGSNFNLIGRTFATLQGMVGLTHYFGGETVERHKDRDMEEAPEPIRVERKGAPTKDSGQKKKSAPSKDDEEDLSEFN